MANLPYAARKKGSLPYTTRSHLRILDLSEAIPCPQITSTGYSRLRLWEVAENMNETTARLRGLSVRKITLFREDANPWIAKSMTTQNLPIGTSMNLSQRFLNINPQNCTTKPISFNEKSSDLHNHSTKPIIFDRTSSELHNYSPKPTDSKQRIDSNSPEIVMFGTDHP